MPKLKTIYAVDHLHRLPSGIIDTKSIGSYTSKREARRAIERLVLQPGFREAPAGFVINAYEIDKPYWHDDTRRESQPIPRL
jgi:hypothetical protein